MKNYIETIQKTADFIQTETNFNPRYGIILGTGLGKLVNEIRIEQEISYDKISGFPISTVESHHGKLIFGHISEKPVVAMQGRFHYYEGYSMKEVTFPIRVMKFLGIEKLFLSNAAGGLNVAMEQGDLMILNDHINLQPDNPLRGWNDDKLGPRFPDMSEPYDKSLIDMGLEIANKHQIRCSEGVYASLPGPNLETKAEYRFLHTIGADAVGMSTVPEVIVANHMELPCFAVSVITNMCYPPEKIKYTTAQDVIDAAGKAEAKMTTIMKEIILSL